MGRVDVEGVGIEYEVTGAGRPVVLLHGFPDSGRLWRHQVPALAEAGFQVIVPNLRGYGRSDKPQAVEAYSLPLLAADVVAVWASWRSAAPMWLATTGAPPWPGRLPLYRPATLITWSRCRSATRPRSAARRGSAKNRDTCCCSSSPASPNVG